MHLDAGKVCAWVPVWKGEAEEESGACTRGQCHLCQLFLLDNTNLACPLVVIGCQSNTRASDWLQGEGLARMTSSPHHPSSSLLTVNIPLVPVASVVSFTPPPPFRWMSLSEISDNLVPPLQPGLCGLVFILLTCTHARTHTQPRVTSAVAGFATRWSCLRFCLFWGTGGFSPTYTHRPFWSQQQPLHLLMVSVFGARCFKASPPRRHLTFTRARATSDRQLWRWNHPKSSSSHLSSLHSAHSGTPLSLILSTFVAIYNHTYKPRTTVQYFKSTHIISAVFQ